MQIREVGNSDIEAVAMLLEEFRGHAVTPESISDHFTEILQDDSRTIIVAEEDGAVLGMAAINLIFKLPKTEARIDEVVVTESAQGKGYGAMLMKTCEEWAWSHGADCIEMTSRPSRQAANALYQKLDYTIRETNVYNKKKAK